MREIHIRPVLNGFIVTVGCTTIVKECGIADLSLDLVKYYTNPNMVEREYQRKAVNKMDRTEIEPGPIGYAPTPPMMTATGEQAKMANLVGQPIRPDTNF